MLFYLLPFALLCAALVVAAIVRPSLIYEYPYFMATAFAVFILPQAYALYRNEWGGWYLQTTYLMCFLCLGCCWLGYRFRPHPRLIERLNVPIDTGRFLHGGILLILVGWYFTYKFGMLPEEELSTMLTGIGTIYLFFGGLVYPGFAICFYCALKEKRLFPWVATILAAIVPIQAALFYGRREPTVLFLLSLALGLYFTLEKKPPRWAIVVAIIVATMAIPATSEYRQLAREDPLEALSQIDFAQEFRDSLDPEAISELKNATALIAATQSSGDYEFGAGYWNSVVFRFVPAQFLGKEFKSSLMIGGEQRDMSDFVEGVLGFRLPGGTTVSGVGDSFNEFGYFGCVFFAAVGYLFKTLWAATKSYHGIVAQILYIQLATSAMRTVTHQTTAFVPGLIYSTIFIWIVAVYATDHSQSEVLNPAQAHPELLPK